MDGKKKVSRRRFLGTSVGVGVGLGIAGCVKSVPRVVVPYVSPPDDEIPGKARYYRTVCRACPAGCGVTARVREGRVVKLEGSEVNPIGAGALCAVGQAAIEALYSPERLSAPLARTGGNLVKVGWGTAQKRLEAGLKQALDRKQQVVVVSRPEPGALGAFFGTWLKALGQDPAQVVHFDPMEPTWVRQGAKVAFGRDAQPRYHLDQARFVLSIGADLLEDWGSPVEYERQLASLRAAHPAGPARFVYVGPHLSLTAAAADRWLSVTPGTELELVLGLAREVRRRRPTPAGLDPATLKDLDGLLAPYTPERVSGITGLSARHITGLARALLAGPGLVVGPGRTVAGPDAVTLAEAVHVLDALIGAVGHTLTFDDAPPAPEMTLAELVRRCEAGKVGAVLFHHADPLGYGDAFAPLGKALRKVGLVATLGNRFDATAHRAHLALPIHHFLETWDELTPRPGVRAIQQPVMTPVWPTRPADDLLLTAARDLGRSDGLPDQDLAGTLQDRLAAADIERGGVFGTAAPATVTLARSPLDLSDAEAREGDSVPVVVLTPSVRHLDGQGGVNALLEEIPDPVTTITWSGFAEVHPDTARAKGLRTGDLVKLATGAGHLELPAYVHTGVRPGVFAVPLAYASALLGPGAVLGGWQAKATVAPTGRRKRPAMIGGNLTQDARHLAREVRGNGRLPKVAPLPSLYPKEKPGKRRWALAVDLDRCNGCGACVAACYVENNCAVVGPAEVRNGRDMAWIHIERFVSTEAGSTRVRFLPVMCQQCGDAPCEAVCPVYATYHTDEGLNAQVYNRCVGTRFCGNDCPYTCRRFNWFDWPHPKPSNLALNPDVTVRSRGVMEKCTFCIQRIRGAEEAAKMAHRPLREGEVTPACVQTCAAEALVFGDLEDPRSRVAKLAADGRAYRLLEELNTRPGVTYLARRRHEEMA